ncbi:hypothetical protein C8P68_102863 [Mucilaginibacter yixingensis]|uniref:Lipocalin-like protein n=1 Tax=Mucilaginibacter yixingensis TaxID=1295612 RepID=A0A2T5JE36_9SPHI|nr:hypothetical protein [Mucilaginibacter yixingensis]PTR00032.1 hypothetical protein C8P68_102863 [Mucilaginibacter yixingensis]
MKNLIKATLAVAAIALMFACNKKNDPSDQTNNTNTSLVGKWLVVKENIKVYSLANNDLLKDSIRDYTISYNALIAWSEIYKADGRAYVTGHPYTKSGKTVVDTSAYLKYTFNNNVLMQSNTDGTNPTTCQVSRLDDKQLEYTVTSNRPPDSGWGLNTSNTYKYVSIYTYTRQ